MSRDCTDLLESGLFLGAWYCASYGVPAVAEWAAVLDFLGGGWQRGRAPNPYFDCAYYLRESPDVAAAGQNPLLHYLRHGDREGRRPVPFFDPVWYRNAHAVPASRTALAHFLAGRLDGSTRPVPEFDPVRHLRLHPPLADAGRDPFLHFQAIGGAAPPDSTVAAACGLFDASFYLVSNADVREAGVDPLAHFCADGWREGRNPNLYFDTRYYRAQVVVGGAEVNPLVHYYLQGERAGLRPSVYFDPGWYASAYTVPAHCSALAHYLARRRQQRHSPNPGFDLAAYLARFGERVGRNRDPFAHALRAGFVSVGRPGEYPA